MKGFSISEEIVKQMKEQFASKECVALLEHGCKVTFWPEIEWDWQVIDRYRYKNRFDIIWYNSEAEAYVIDFIKAHVGRWIQNKVIREVKALKDNHKVLYNYCKNTVEIIEPYPDWMRWH